MNWTRRLTFYFLLIALIFNSKTLFGQLTEENFIPPLDIPLLLSGNFGELRGSHLHAGLDIKTKGRQGLPVSAFWGGKISRIAVRTSGYGKALYVEHPNGKMTVYAHLKKFAPKIEAYVKAKQYERKTYSIQLFPKENELEVEPGEVIGYSGNTGGSLGPHLHFEVRETASQNPINPLQYDLAIEDQQRPQIREVYLYHHSDKGVVKKEYPFFKENDSLFATGLIKASGVLSVGLNTFDRQDLSYNKNGVYKASVWLNGVKKFERVMDQISFADGKFMSLMMDQEALKLERKKIEKLVHHPKNKISFLKDNTQDGYLEIQPGKSYLISVLLTDYHDNQTQLEVYVTGDETSKIVPQKPPPGKRIDPTVDHLFTFDKVEVYFPKNSFFDPQYLTIEAKQDTLYLDQDRLIPNKPIELSFTKEAVNTEEKKQLTLAKIVKGKPYFVPTKNKEATFSASVKSLGTYTLVKDTLPPTLRAQNFKSNQSINRFRYLTFRLEDEFSGIAKYEGYINDQWILLEHEPKTKTLTYDLSDLNFETKELNIVLRAEDGCGNQTEYKTEVRLD